MRFHGTVARQAFGSGSKSEHQAIVLLTDQGPLKLRRVGGNPFSDPELEKLVGQTISCEAQTSAGQIIMSEWKVGDSA